MSITLPRFAALAALSLTLGLTTAAHAGERITRFHGADGGTVVHGRVTHSDGAGNRESFRGGAFRGTEGRQGMRASHLTRNADGSAERTGGFAASGPNGSIRSQGSVTRSTDGDINGQRTTTGTGSQGNTYQGSTTYSRSDGVSHTATCSDAAGTPIPCSR